MDNLLSTLETEYCPPLDSAVVFAVGSDLNLSAPAELAQARETLDYLKSNAELEQATSFDPSGSSHPHDFASAHGSPSLAYSKDGDLYSHSEETEETSLTRSIESLALNSSESRSRSPASSLDNDFDPVEIQEVLSSWSKSFGSATDELLTREFLRNSDHSGEEVVASPKGIDGFAIEDDDGRSRRGKNKGRKRKSSPTKPRSMLAPQPSSNNAPATSNRWLSLEADVEYISQKTQLPTYVVKSFYHKANMSFEKTITSLSKSEHVTANGVFLSEAILDHAYALSAEFPAVEQEQLIGIVQLTFPSTETAYELAKAIVEARVSSNKASSVGDVLVPQYIRPAITGDLASTTAATNTITTTSKVQDGARRPIYRSADIDSAIRSDPLFVARQRDARAKAHAAMRRSKSQPLMGAVASHYALERRSLWESESSRLTNAAHSLAAARSSASHVDLHGMRVEDAVAIVGERVQAWWASPGRAEWAREGKVMGADAGAGYRIITGAGHHSVGGVAKIKPAVRKFLVAGGWRIREEQAGEIVVTGRARRNS